MNIHTISPREDRINAEHCLETMHIFLNDPDLSVYFRSRREYAPIEGPAKSFEFYASRLDSTGQNTGKLRTRYSNLRQKLEEMKRQGN